MERNELRGCDEGLGRFGVGGVQTHYVPLMHGEERSWHAGGRAATNERVD